MATLKQQMAAAEKATGITGNYGGTYVQIPRAPTGIFPLDLALGGGLPRGRICEIYGMESSGKTNILQKTIALNQVLNPKELNMFIDMEGSFDPKWAAALGVDVDKLYVVRPDFGEQAGNFVDQALQATDVGIIGLDSIGALGTSKELEGDMEDFDPGGVARCFGKIIRKATRRLRMRETDKKMSDATFICINQIRHKIGGNAKANPETTPGGFAPKFAYAARVKVRAYNKVNNAINNVLPYAKETSAEIIKWKMPITAKHAEYDMFMLPFQTFKPGDVDDWNLAEKLMREVGIIEAAEGKKGPDGKKLKGWFMAGEIYPTLRAAKERYCADTKWRIELQQRFIARAVAKMDFAPEGEVEFDTTTGEIEPDAPAL